MPLLLLYDTIAYIRRAYFCAMRCDAMMARARYRAAPARYLVINTGRFQAYYTSMRH